MDAEFLNQNNIGSVMLLVLMFLSVGMILGFVSGKIIGKTLLIIFLMPIGAGLVKVAIPIIQNQYGNMGVFLTIVVAIVLIMSCFDFTRTVLAGMISSFFYGHIRIILIATGVLAFTYSLMYKLAAWIKL